MTDKKLTDKEIIKALECCANGKCGECPLFKEDCGDDIICKNALDLITRQQAEIESLKVENQSFRSAANSLKMHYEEAQAEIERLNALVKTKNKLIEGLDQSISYAYDRAIKDFAERLKNEIINDTAYACDSTQHSGYYDYQIKIGDIPEYIDNLVKEMVGDDNA